MGIIKNSIKSYVWCISNNANHGCSGLQHSKELLAKKTQVRKTPFEADSGIIIIILVNLIVKILLQK